MIFNILSANNNKSKETEKKLISLLKDYEMSMNNFDTLFVIGGDGFFLSVMQKMFMKDVKIIFINSGTLGFYSILNYKDLDQTNLKEVTKNGSYISLDMLEVVINNKKKYYCVNDFSFSNNHTTNFELTVNDVHVENFFGNGFLVSTNAGSTARNKSIGGPIIFPNLSVMIFSEIESIQNRYNNSLKSPIVLNSTAILNINIKNRNKNKGCFLVDGIEINNNIIENNIKINMLKTKAKVLIKNSISDYAKKLKYAFIDKD